MDKKIKLIIIDLYGVMSFGSYQDTCRWLARKYDLDYKECYRIVYHKYFCRAAAGKISEAESFNLAAKELKIKESGSELRAKHLSFQRLNRPIYNLAIKLKKTGYKILLLSKNTPAQFKHVVEKFKLYDHFKIINCYYFRMDKKSPGMMKYILKKYKLTPAEVLMTDDQDFNLTYAKKIGVKIILYKDFSSFKKQIVRLGLIK
ncbi:MAG: HAD hydrolase-like protein [Candidatus Falkowbacteria bacterium]|nr:HAD hydrolase-like protein [Candidatus Falkowbacteria bacterium]